MKLEFSRQILEKYWNIKFSENPSSVGRVVPCVWTDRHDKDNGCSSHFLRSRLKIEERDRSSVRNLV